MKDELLLLEVEGRLLSLVPPLATEDERVEGLPVVALPSLSVFDESSDTKQQWRGISQFFFVWKVRRKREVEMRK